MVPLLNMGLQSILVRQFCNYQQDPQQELFCGQCRHAQFSYCPWTILTILKSVKNIQEIMGKTERGNLLPHIAEDF